MTEPSKPSRIPDHLRSKPARSTRGTPSNTGPSPSRIMAAAASIAGGVGLVALMASSAGGQDIVIEVQPAPILVQPIATNGAETTPEIRVIRPATPVEPAGELTSATTQAPQPAPQSESEGS